MIASKGFYQLPAVHYGYGDLAPSMSEQLLRVPHDGHHRKYLSEVNGLLENMDNVRVEGSMLIMRSEAQSLAFNVGGHFLHSLYWNNNVREHASSWATKTKKPSTLPTSGASSTGTRSTVGCKRSRRTGEKAQCRRPRPVSP